MALPTSTTLPTLADDLARRAAQRRPDLAGALTDGGWVVVCVLDAVFARDGLAFTAGEHAIARPAVARHVADFVVFSERLGRLVGLRHGEQLLFADEAASA